MPDIMGAGAVNDEILPTMSWICPNSPMDARSARASAANASAAGSPAFSNAYTAAMRIQATGRSAVW